MANGKGDRNRVTDRVTYRSNYDAIFRCNRREIREVDSDRRQREPKQKGEAGKRILRLWQAVRDKLSWRQK